MIRIGLTPEQHELRAHHVGASEVAAVMGLSPYRSPYDVWCQKTGQGRQVDMSPAAEWGLRLEAAVLGKYLDAHDEVIEAVAYPGTIVHEGGVLCCTPDCIVTLRDGSRRNVQIKTASAYARDSWGDSGLTAIPQHYWWQVQAEMLVTGIEVSDVVVLIGGQDYREYTIDRDESACQIIALDVADWWHTHVVERQAPPTDPTHPTALDEVRARLQQGSDEIVEIADDPLKNEITAYRCAQDMIDTLERLNDERQARLCQLIGEKAGVQVAQYLVTWKASTTRGRVDWEQMARALGAQAGLDSDAIAIIAQDYTAAPKTSRRFSIRERKI